MKETRQQIIETTRNKVVKQFEEKIKSLEEKIEKLSIDYTNEQKRCLAIQEKYDDLQEKYKQNEDWNQRLQEFMDMNDNDRKNYIVNLKTKMEINKKMNDMFGVFNSYISLFN